MLQTLSQKGVWVNILALIAAIGAAFGLDLGLDTQTQTEIAVGLAGIVAVINAGMHAVQRSREKKAAGSGSGSGSGSINTSMLLLPVLLMCLFVAACASMPTPQTPRQAYAYTDSSFTAAVQTLNSMHDQGMLTPAEETRFDTLFQRGNAALNTARTALDSGDTSTVQGRLSVVDSILVQLRTIIAKEQNDE